MYPKPRRHGRFKFAIYGHLRINRVPALRYVSFRISKRPNDQTLSPQTITESAAGKESTLGSTLDGSIVRYGSTHREHVGPHHFCPGQERQKE